MKQTCVLIILDGWGIGRNDISNPVYQMHPPTIAAIKSRYPMGALQSSGIAVGLPWGEEGNSEVGHLTIGAGRVIYQHYPRITLAIQNKEFFNNKVFLDAISHVKKNNSALNLVGLLTEGNIHASFEHFVAMIRLAKEQGVSQLNLHLFSDGKDSRPRSVLSQLARLKSVFEEYGLGNLASLSGRIYGLDRDGHWDRTQKAYDAMTGSLAPSQETIEAVVARTYEQNENDDFLEPLRLEAGAQPINDNDGVLFMDFREDSIRQIVSPFVLKDFDKFPIKPFTNLYIATLTDYSKRFLVPVAFPSEFIGKPLGKVLSDAGKIQMLVTETEKYAHVTYFFNGYRDESFPNQFKILIPSRSVTRHDEHPEMMAEEIANRVVEAIEDRSFNFIIANFANTDIIAHTGNFEAALKAVQIVDEQLGRIVAACEATDSALLITSDHGHVEKMRDPYTGAIETKHDTNPVPLYYVSREAARPRSSAEMNAAETEVIGILSDVAPTVLDVLGIAKPTEMTGRSLLGFLR